MILVTDGQNGDGPEADDPDLLEEVLEADVKIVTIAFGLVP